MEWNLDGEALTKPQKILKEHRKISPTQDLGLKIDV
jgi:hypothetical protein